MKCTNCGREFPLGRFCPSCGTPAPEAAAQNSLAATPEEQPVFETYTYPEAEPAVEPQPEVSEHTYRPPVTPVMPAKRKFPLVAIAVVLALVLVVGGLFALFGPFDLFTLGSRGPADAIGKGVQKTLKSETFNFDVTVDAEGETMNFTGTIEFNPKDYVLNMYMDATYTASSEKVTMCIYDGQFFGYTSSDGEKWYTYSEVDEDAIEEFCDYYLEYSDSDLNKKKDVLAILEELDDLTDGELSELVDLEIMAECVTEYVGEHNDTKWLEENAGFSQEKKGGVTYYTYEPNLYEFCEVSLPYFEEAFEDDDLYDEGMDTIKESKSELKAIKLEITFGIKSGYLTTVLLDVEGVTIEAIFSDFGKAELDYDELDDLASECEKGYEDQYDAYYGYYD